jgi:hypothetical protein
VRKEPLPPICLPGVGGGSTNRRSTHILAPSDARETLMMICSIRSRASHSTKNGRPLPIRTPMSGRGRRIQETNWGTSYKLIKLPKNVAYRNEANAPVQSVLRTKPIKHSFGTLLNNQLINWVLTMQIWCKMLSSNQFKHQD